MEILIISGLSGSGKSRAATFLEDIGYYIVDNLPAEMMLKFANFCTASGGRYDRVALVYDVRAGEPFQRLIDVLDKLRRRDGVRCRMLFLETDTRVIISRYKETRRSHPLCAEGISIEEAVRRERELLAPVREHADFVLDTTAFSTSKLRSELLTLFGGGRAVFGATGAAAGVSAAPVFAGGTDGAGHCRRLHRRPAPLHGNGTPSGHLHRRLGVSGV